MKQIDLKALLTDKKDLYVAAGCLILASLIGLWLFQKDPEPTQRQASLGQMIPKGFALLPLNLSNLESLTSLIEARGVLDLFNNKNELIVENVRILKTYKNDHAQFGALIPTAQVKYVKKLFSRPELSGVIRPDDSPPTAIHKQAQERNLLDVLND
jgi:hypothetical protein